MVDTDYFKERVRDVVMELMAPFDNRITKLDEKNGIRMEKIEESVIALKVAYSRWSGGIAVLLFIMIGMEALFSGGCNNKLKVSLDSPPGVSQNKGSQVSSEPSIPQER